MKKTSEISQDSRKSGSLFTVLAITFAVSCGPRSHPRQEANYRRVCGMPGMVPDLIVRGELEQRYIALEEPRSISETSDPRIAACSPAPSVGRSGRLFAPMAKPPQTNSIPFERQRAVAVTGIGGFFFRARDPEALSAWYRSHFGITGYEEAVWQQEAGPTVFMPFPADTDHFAADKQFMINLRVDDLDTLLVDLRRAGIEVTTDPSWDAPETGRFARVHDPEGNAVEIWQPPAD